MPDLPIYEQAAAPSTLPDTLRLTPGEWSAYFLCSPRRSGGEIARLLGWDDGRCERVFNKLLSDGLVREAACTLAELGAARAFDRPADPAAPIGLTAYLTGTAQTAATPSIPAGTPAPAFRPLPPPPARPMSLRAVIDYILGLHTDKTTGQLAVYRVFMGIDTRLLRRNGITSLRFQEDRLIEDPELRRAIERRLESELHTRPPGTLFNAAA